MVSEIKNTIQSRHGLDRAIWIGLLLVLATAIFSITLLQLSLGVLVILCFAKLIQGLGRGFRSTALDVPVLAFIIGRTVSIVFSVHPAISVPAFYIEFIFYAAFFVFTNILEINREKEIVVLLQLLILTAVVAAGIGIFQYTTGMTQRAQSTTSGPYTFSLYLIAVLPLALFLVRDSRIFKNHNIAYAAIAVILLGVVFSLNRLHWIAMAATLVVAAVISKDKVPLLIFGVLFIACFVTMPEIAHRFQLTLTVFSHTGGRDVLWRGAGVLYAEHPLFGFGPRTFREVFPFMSQLLDRQTGSWHNDFLQVYMESGVVGLVPFVWVIVAAVSSMVAALRTKVYSPFLLPLTVAFCMFVVVGGMLDTIVGIVFRLYLAMIALMTAQPMREKYA